MMDFDPGDRWRYQRIIHTIQDSGADNSVRHHALRLLASLAAARTDVLPTVQCEVFGAFPDDGNMAVSWEERVGEAERAVQVRFYKGLRSPEVVERIVHSVQHTCTDIRAVLEHLALPPNGLPVARLQEEAS